MLEYVKPVEVILGVIYLFILIKIRNVLQIVCDKL